MPKTRARPFTVYDKAKFHTEAADFPPRVPRSRGAQHIGYVVRFCAEKGLLSDGLVESAGAAAVKRLVAGGARGSAFVLKHCDGALTEEDLNEAGNAFLRAHYQAFLVAYEKAWKRLAPSTYLVPETEEHYRKARRILERLRKASAGRRRGRARGAA